MKHILLTQGKYAIVDTEDYEWLNQWKWCAYKGVATWYATSRINGKMTKMHCLIMKTPRKMDTDHINCNGLDNRKRNLRICSRSQHHYNRKPKKGKYKGVVLSGRMGKWQARITIKRKRLSLGYYKSKKAAAEAYDIAAMKYCGAFARTNF